MSSVNKAVLVGNVGKDPVVSTTQGGVKVARFSIATSERWTDKQSGEKKERTEWHNIVVWDSLANVVEKYVAKGSKLYVEGKLQTRKWQDQSGQDRYTTEIVLQGFGAQLVLLSGKSEGEQESRGESRASNGGGNSYASAKNGASKPATSKQTSFIDDEIPFHGDPDLLRYEEIA